MKSATVRDLRNRYASVLRWVHAGEDVLISRKGKIIARLSPKTEQGPVAVNWADSPEVKRDRSGDTVPSANESAELLHQAGGKW
jgi:prevent-host-death family protein